MHWIADVLDIFNLLNLSNPSPARLAFPRSTRFILPLPQHLPHPTPHAHTSVMIVLKSHLYLLWGWWPSCVALYCLDGWGGRGGCLQTRRAFFLMVIWAETALWETWTQKTGFRQGWGLMLSALAWERPWVWEAQMRCGGAVFAARDRPTH